MLKIKLSGRISFLRREEGDPNSVEHRSGFIITEYGVRRGKEEFNLFNADLSRPSFVLHISVHFAKCMKEEETHK